MLPVPTVSDFSFSYSLKFTSVSSRPRPSTRPVLVKPPSSCYVRRGEGNLSPSSLTRPLQLAPTLASCLPAVFFLSPLSSESSPGQGSILSPSLSFSMYFLGDRIYSQDHFVCLRFPKFSLLPDSYPADTEHSQGACLVDASNPTWLQWTREAPPRTHSPSSCSHRKLRVRLHLSFSHIPLTTHREILLT